jgi:cyanophycinase-like exopeptidase
VRSAVLVKTISLLGSGAFETWAEEVDRLALGSSSGDARAAVLLVGVPGDELDRRAEGALRHFARVGAPADVVPVGSRADAFASELRDRIDGVCLVHLSAPDAETPIRTLVGTPLWETLLAGLDRGAAFTASGGAIGALGDSAFVESDHPARWDDWSAGLRLLEGTIVVPHWDDLGRTRPELQEFLAREVPTDETVIAIDDRTALIGDGDLWQVKGSGQVQIRIGDVWNTYGDGAAFLLPSSVTVLPEADAEGLEAATAEQLVVLPDDQEQDPKQEPDLLVG